MRVTESRLTTNSKNEVKEVVSPITSSCPTKRQVVPHLSLKETSLSTRARKDAPRAQPPGRSFWTKCPQCGTVQALDQGSWAHVGSFLLYCCAFCAFHQLISTALVNFSDPNHVNPVEDVLPCDRCADHVMLLESSGNKICLNCDVAFLTPSKDRSSASAVSVVVNGDR